MSSSKTKVEARLDQSSSSAAIGKTLGRYEIERELGRGGMGVVYLAQDVNLNRRIALKTTTVTGSSENSRNQRRARFVREVRALAQVNHANVVHVFDAAEADDPDLGWLLYYSMEYVEGFTLAELVQKKGAMEHDAAAAVCAQVAAGLGAAHTLGIVHRDVKPANVFLTQSGRALIGDFGICKMEGSTQITRRDQLIGTPNYLAPEQILGDPITPATDVFAIGALYFVIATNSPLRKKLDAASLLRAAQEEGPSNSMLALEHIPAPLRKVLAKALSRDPAKRQKTCAELAEELTEFAGRIPTLDETSSSTAEPKEKKKKAKPSRSNTPAPFPNLSSEVPKPIGDISSSQTGKSVEDVAAALLKEVKAPTGSSEKKRKKESPGALPEAQVESTVLFNLRTFKEREDKTLNPSDGDEDGSEILVAETESTVMFNLRQLEEHDEKRAAAAIETAPETSDSNIREPMSTADAANANIDDKDVAVLVKPEVQSASAPNPEAKKGAKGKILVAVIGLFGIVALVGGILFLKDSGVLISDKKKNVSTDDGSDKKRTTTKAKEIEANSASEKTDADNPAKKMPVPKLEPIRYLPNLCKGKAKDAHLASRADALIEESTAALNKAAYAQAHSLAAKALTYDPRKMDAHFLMAKILVKRKEFRPALDHYRCVDALEPLSKKAATARKILKAASRN
ncbi:MAG: serine/threonine protein kinase [Deltaproteobacteria bacterium]|nr:serine/threonine protein kinase [Deltaproteobacteria bacterium]